MFPNRCSRSAIVTSEALGRGFEARIVDIEDCSPFPIGLGHMGWRNHLDYTSRAGDCLARIVAWQFLDDYPVYLGKNVVSF
jgi:hypothetical protein